MKRVGEEERSKRVKQWRVKEKSKKVSRITMIKTERDGASRFHR